MIDDDPIVGNLTLELLRDAGYSTLLVFDSLQAQDIIKAESPALVVLDILMPGLDGLTLLHRLKSDPATEKIKAVIVSGKSFAAEQQRALAYGAAAFIEKPYNVENFAAKIGEILSAQGVRPTAASSAPIMRAPAKRAELKATVWGCRAPSRGAPAEGSRYGTYTSCVSIETPSNFFIFDAGSGIKLLGEELRRSGKHKQLWLFITHFHRDHVEGLGSFACAHDKNYTLNISGASDPDKPFEAALKETFSQGPRRALPAAKIELYELIEQTYEILPGVRLSAFYANHPGTTLGYVMQTDDRKIIYCPDSELYGDNATALQDYDEKLGAACRNADLMFHDGRYTPEDYRLNPNTGHSNFIAAVDFAGRNMVKELVLVHQDDRYSDDALERMGHEALAHIEARGYKTQVVIGFSGLTLTF